MRSAKNFFLVFLPILLLEGIHTMISSKEVMMVEICDNAADDDGDGLIDLNDPDCECAIIEPVSLIPNPSFEETVCCPQFRSQLHCAEGWIQASEPTTDYIHECGFQGWPGLLPPKPFPDGEGIVGFRDGRNIAGSSEKNWKEYAGACLLSPLKANNQYTFEFYIGFINNSVSPPIDISFFGTEDCAFLPFGTNVDDFGCPTNGPNWKFLGSQRVTANGWIITSITITPDSDIAAIAIGPPCSLNNSDENLYYFFDNLVLAESRFFELQISKEGKDCTSDFRLSIIDYPDYTYQWYKEGVAIPGATSSKYDAALGEGLYSVVVFDGETCRVSKEFDYNYPNAYVLLKETICEDETYDFNGILLSEKGYYVDTISRMDDCDSIVSLDLAIQGDSYTNVYAKIFEGESFEMSGFYFSEAGSYDLNLESSIGCDSLVNLQLSTFDVYIPNIFSPNQDGINDVFKVENKDEFVKIQSLKIYNRWGELMYNINKNNADTNVEWDGHFKGNPVLPGVYSYIMRVSIENKDEKELFGNVTVVR